VPEREADHSPPSSAEVMNAWSYTFTLAVLSYAQGQFTCFPTQTGESQETCRALRLPWQRFRKFHADESSHIFQNLNCFLQRK